MKVLSIVLWWCLSVSFVYALSHFTHAAPIRGYTLELLVGSNYTSGLTAGESAPFFGVNFEHRLLYIDKRNSQVYYLVGGKVIRKLDTNGMVTNIAGSVRNKGNYESISEINDYYYALDRELTDVGGLVIDSNTNDIYILNNGNSMERIRNSDKKSLITVGYEPSETNEGPGNRVSFSYPTYGYPRGLAINSRNEIYMLQYDKISKYDIATYEVSTVFSFENGYDQIVLSQDETFLYAKSNSQVYKLTFSDGSSTLVTELSSLMSIDTFNNELYMLTENGVYIYKNGNNLLIAAGNTGTYTDGMNSTELVISYGTTLLVLNSMELYLSDYYGFALFKIDLSTQKVTNLVKQAIDTNYSPRNFTSPGISKAVQDKINNLLYFCDLNGRIYQGNANSIIPINSGIGSCLGIAVNSKGQVHISNSNHVFKLLSNGSMELIAGTQNLPSPSVGLLSNETYWSNIGGFGFFENDDLFISSEFDLFRVDGTSKNITSLIYSNRESGFYVRNVIHDSITQQFYFTDENSIRRIYQNGSVELVAGLSAPPPARSVFIRKERKGRLMGGELDGESAFNSYLNPSGMIVGDDGKLYYTDSYRVRRIENGLLWTQRFVDSQQGPMHASYINEATVLGRYNDGIMLTNPTGNLLYLKPVYTFTCFGKDPSAPDVCSGFGSCIGPNKCTCQSNFGFECQYAYCNDISGFDFQRVCGGVGTCSRTDSCTCPPAFTGPECKTPLYYICYGVSSNSSAVCSGKGTCVGTNTCSCNPGRVGNNCQYDFCALTWNADSNSVTCANPSSSVVEINQEVVTSSQLNSKVVKFARNPSVSFTFPSDFYNYLFNTYPEIADQAQLTIASSIFDPVLDTSKDLLVVAPIASMSLFKNTSEILPVNNLVNPITVQFNSLKIDKVKGPFNYSCMYYDTQSNSWSSGGIRSTITSSTLTNSFYSFSIKCETYHLTSFSVIDMNYKKAGRDDTITFTGLSAGEIAAIAVTLGASCLICVAIGLVVAGIVGVSMWTKHKKKSSQL